MRSTPLLAAILSLILLGCCPLLAAAVSFVLLGCCTLSKAARVLNLDMGQCPQGSHQHGYRGVEGVWEVFT